MFIVMLVTTTSFTAQENIQTFSREEIVAACAAALGGKENIEAFKTLTFDYCSHAGGPILFSVVPFSVNMIASGEGQEDTSTIAFVSNRDGDLEIYTVNVMDGQITQLTENTGIIDERPNWSPDGKYITFTTDRDGNWEIYRMLTSSPAGRLMAAGLPSCPIETETATSTSWMRTEAMSLD